MKTTIREAAKRLHLSIITVSHTLNIFDGVTEVKRKLVIETAEEMESTPKRTVLQLRCQ